jgi:hypothetical protein
MRNTQVFAGVYLLTGLLSWVLVAIPAAAVPVQLQNGTATFSQPCNNIHSPDEAVDGNFNDIDADGVNGWAIAATCDDQTDNATNQTAVWETTTNVTGNGLTFTMYFNHFNPGHLLGRFRFSVTTDDRATFADGLDTGGDVEANWTVLTHPTVSGPAEMTFTTLADHSILAGGTIPAQGTYTVIYETPVSDITGVRLEVLEDPSLPFNGPGLFPGNSNFMLTEMTLDATPIPILDHFLCYKAKGDSVDVTVSLQDQFGGKPGVLVEEPELFCNPVDKNDEGISDATAHLTCYKIKEGDKKQQVRIENQFGEQTLKVKKPTLLCVPSKKIEVIQHKEKDDDNDDNEWGRRGGRKEKP